MTYFFVSPEQIKGRKVTLTGPDVVHITRVLRFQAGDALTVLDGQGRGYRVRLSKMDPRQVEGVIEEEFFVAAEAPVHITLVQGMPKGEKMELIIQKCTELGVQEIIPLKAERSLVKLSGEKLQQRLLRWQRIAMEAAKQCRRGKVPRVGRPMSLEEVVSVIPPGASGLMTWEEEREASFKSILKELKGEKVFLFIGPEGGFTPKEVTLAKKHNVATVSLGKRILRTETAALAAVTMILYELGDLGGSA